MSVQLGTFEEYALPTRKHSLEQVKNKNYEIEFGKEKGSGIKPPFSRLFLAD